MTKTKKGDCVEIKYTGYLEGEPFDSNIPEDLKRINEKAEPEKTVVIIGQGMVIQGLDKSLEEKELNKEYKIEVPYREGFGPKRRELVKTIPLSVFTKQGINPKPGASLLLDNNLARIITISGARVMTDFNNPLAGKDISYRFTITRIVTDEKEKAEAFFRNVFRYVPELEVKDKSIVAKGPKILEGAMNNVKGKFKELIGKDLEFEEKEPERPKLEDKVDKNSKD